jgi:hypothetical protein
MTQREIGVRADLWNSESAGQWHSSHRQSGAQFAPNLKFCVAAIQAILKNMGGYFAAMAKLVFGMNQSLDGYVDHQEFSPGPTLFRHFIEQVRGLTGSVYGRRLYEVMRSPCWRPGLFTTMSKGRPA